MECLMVFSLIAVAVIAIFAVVIIRGALKDVRELQERLDRVEAWLAALPRTATPPSSPRPAVQPAGAVAPPLPAEPRAAAPAAAIGLGAASADPPAAPAQVIPPAARPAPPAAAQVAASGSGGGIDFEAQIAARWPVWIGAICLALAGMFLVKYAFENDWLGPAVRVALGVVFGVGLLAVGEWSFGRTPRIPAALSAAGIAVLYASFLAAGRLYDLVPHLAAFALMALTTAVAIGLSLRQGRLIAVVGLAGGFLAPALLGPTPDPRPAPLFAYLLLLQVGLLVVTRRRGWYELAGLTLAAGLVWVMVWLAEPYEEGDSRVLGLFLLTSTAAFVASTWGRAGVDAWKPPRAAELLGWAAMAGALVVMAPVIGLSDFGSLEWAYLGLLGAGAIIMGRLDRDYLGLPWLAAGLTALLLAIWGFSEGWRLGMDGDALTVARYLGTLLALGAVFAVGGYAALWGAARPPVWAALSGTAGVVYFLVGYGVLRWQSIDFPWGATAIVLALVYVVAAFPIARQRRSLALGGPPPASVDAAEEPDPPSDNASTTPVEGTDYRHATESLAALAAAATVFISLAVPIELQREWITVAWALEVAALVWLAGALGVPALRWLAWPLIALVGVRLLLNPFVLDYPIGAWPVFNWLLYGYGLPIIAFALAARESADAGDRRMAVVLEWLAMALGLYLIGLQVRHFYHRDDMGDFPFFLGDVYLAEWGVLIVAWLLYALGLLWAGRRWALPSLALGAQVVTGIALGLGLVALGLVANPAWTHSDVGSPPFFNRLLFAYGAPALLALVVARALASRGDIGQRGVWVIGAAALLFVFVGLTLEVRQAFRGPFLDSGGATLAEQYAYSLTWVLLGIGLLVLGIVTQGRLLRYASLAVMVVAVAKVFLYDMSYLSGLYRVFSFFGLGLSLLLLGYVYQRFVLREEAP